MAEDRGVASVGFSRRRLMRRAGMTAAGVAVAAVGADALIESPATKARQPLPIEGLDPEGLIKPDPIPKENLLEGEIISVGQRKLVIESVDSGPVEIELAQNAFITRDGFAPLSAYRAGDEVVVLGEHRDNVFTAVGVAAMLRTLDVTVSSRDGSVLNTNEGKVLITPTTMPQHWATGKRGAEARPLADIEAGDEIRVMGLRNKKSLVINASQVGVLTSP